MAGVKGTPRPPSPFSELVRTLQRSGWEDYVFAFHDDDEIGPAMLARIAKHTGLTPHDL
jgi:predicted RNA binding protein YcfA (HicA-like mRNA interferase family)